jgi:predicted solute-binding protein
MVIDALTLIDSDISVLQTEKVEKITFDDLCSRYSITSIGKLKIDVERHEHAILPSVLEKIRTGMKINSLFVEHYPNDVNYHLKQDLFSSIEKCGYERIDYDFDVSLIKNETNISM